MYNVIYNNNNLPSLQTDVATYKAAYGLSPLSVISLWLESIQWPLDFNLQSRICNFFVYLFIFSILQLTGTLDFLVSGLNLDF